MLGNSFRYRFASRQIAARRSISSEMSLFSDFGASVVKCSGEIRLARGRLNLDFIGICRVQSMNIININCSNVWGSVRISGLLMY